MAADHVVMAGHDNEGTVEIPQLQSVGMTVDAHEMRKQFGEDDVETGYTHGVNLDVSAVSSNSSGPQCGAVSCSETEGFGHTATHACSRRYTHVRKHPKTTSGHKKAHTRKKKPRVVGQ